MAGTLIRNPSIQALPLPAPFSGVVKGGGLVTVGLSPAQVLVVCPTIGNGFTITQLPDGYSGPYDITPTSAPYGYALPLPPGDAPGAVLWWDGTKWSATPIAGMAGQVLTSAGADPPAWQDPSGGGLPTFNGAKNLLRINDANDGAQWDYPENVWIEGFCQTIYDWTNTPGATMISTGSAPYGLNCTSNVISAFLATNSTGDACAAIAAVSLSTFGAMTAGILGNHGALTMLADVQAVNDAVSLADGGHLSGLAPFTYDNAAGTLTAGVNADISGMVPLNFPILWRLLKSNQEATGIYTLTDTGSGSTPPVFTRRADQNSTGQFANGNTCRDASSNALYACEIGGGFTLGWQLRFQMIALNVPPQYMAAQLPEININGQIVWVLDGCKVGELTGAGTGVLAYYSTDNWRVFSTDAPVTT